MLFACIITNILAIVLPSLRISPQLLIQIATNEKIGLLYAAALSFNVVYIQSIGSAIGNNSGLFHMTLISQIILYLVVALNIMPRSLLNTNTSLCVLCRMARIVTIALLYGLTIILLFFHVQLIIDYVLSLFGELFNPPSSLGVTIVPDTLFLLFCSVAPIKPAADKPSRLSNEQKAQFNLSKEQEEILVGLLLGDLFARKYKGSVNACLRFEQGIVHQDYIYYLYQRFSTYCSMVPEIISRAPHKGTGKVYSSIYFSTYSLPCFNKYFDMFYPNGKK